MTLRRQQGGVKRMFMSRFSSFAEEMTARLQACSSLVLNDSS